MLPRLLDANYNGEFDLHPEKLTANLNLTPLSTATMNLPEGEPAVGLRKWVEIFSPYGSLGKFRVASVKTAYGTGQTIGLEHGIATLGDNLTAASTTLTGTPYAIMGTLLGYQSLWQRGTIPDTGSYTVKVDRSNVLSAVLDLLKQMNGYTLTYDFSTTPWALGIVAMETTPSCECRMSRNAIDVSVTFDDNDLCTRVYAVGLTDGYMDADTVSTWGVIAKSLGTDENADAEEVQAYATEYLAEYKNPRVNIEITAMELAAQTGETIDAFVIGKLCRVALPDWGYTTDQRIVAVVYSDLLGNPSDVKLSLSTAPRDLSRTLAGISSDLYGTSTVKGGSGSSGGGGGGGSGKGKLEEYRTSIVQNADSIQLMAWDLGDLNNGLIDAQASISLNASNILLRVEKNGVISSINQTAESITISASRVNLSGYTTISQLNAKFAEIDGLSVSSFSVTNLGCTSGAFSSLTANTTLRYGNDTIDKSSKTVVTNTSITQTKTQVSGVWVVTDVTLAKSTSSMNYLSY